MVRVTVANVADGASTALAMGTQGAHEGNPLGWWVVPIKLGTAYGIIPLVPPEYQDNVAKVSSCMTWGAVANNLLVAVGATSVTALSVGFGVFMPYALLCDFDYLPKPICPWRYAEDKWLEQPVQNTRASGKGKD